MTQCIDLVWTWNVINDCNFFFVTIGSVWIYGVSCNIHIALFIVCILLFKSVFESSLRFLVIYLFYAFNCIFHFCSICHLKLNKKKEKKHRLYGSIWHTLITIRQYKMWFYANGWKVFKDHHGVWLDFRFSQNIVWS